MFIINNNFKKNKKKNNNNTVLSPTIDHWLWLPLLPVLHPDGHRVRLHPAGGARVPPAVRHGHRAGGQNRAKGAACDKGHHNAHTRYRVVVDHSRVMVPSIGRV